MKGFRDIKVKRQLHAILQILANNEAPVGSARLSQALRIAGIQLTDRAIRDYLMITDSLGWTESYGKKGRKITLQGLKELETGLITDRVGFVASRVEELAYQMDFDLNTQRGKIILNVSCFKKKYLKNYLRKICRVFDEDLGMGKLVMIADENTQLGTLRIPKGEIGFGTICSVSLNGIFLKYGITMSSRFGTLVELEKRQPKRFVQIISYDGTTVDPLEIFIRGRMTDVWGAVETGDGIIGVSFREIASVALSSAKALAKKAERCLLGGILTFGTPNQPLLDMPVPQGRTGILVLAGLNPLAVLSEHGIEVTCKAMCSLYDYNSLMEYTELERYIYQKIL